MSLPPDTRPAGKEEWSKVVLKPCPLVAAVFEGGTPAPGPELDMARLRAAMTLDLLSVLQATPGVDEVVLATCFPELAQEARALGVGVLATAAAPFHFGRELARVGSTTGAQAMICLGGASAPLWTVADFAHMALTVRSGSPTVVVNNRGSADVCGFSPAAVLDDIALPSIDNPLGSTLRRAGLRRVLMPNSARMHFDVDTPSEALLLKVVDGAGPRTRAALAALEWDPGPVRRLLAALRSGPLAAVGRVDIHTAAEIGRRYPMRLHLFAEGQGLRWRGHDRPGGVRSLIAYLYAEVGAERFFRLLAQSAVAAVIDTRILFYHAGHNPSINDRYYSDLGQSDGIGDGFLRGLTRASAQAAIPVLLGGHTLVAGGLWLLAEQAYGRRT
jgi:hypothetical protein